MLNWRAVWNSRSSTTPNEMSLSGLLKIGSHTARTAASNSSTRVPAGTQPESTCKLRDAPVVAVEEREEVLGEIVLVALVERADDAEVDGGVLRLLRVGDVDEDVAGVHVGMKEIVAKHLREEDLDAVLREPLDVGARGAQRLHVVDGMPTMRSIAITFGRQIVPIDLGHVQQRRAREIAPQLRGVGRLAHEVELDERASSRTRATTSTGCSRRASGQ